MITQLTPVLVISTSTTGSHCTVYPCGTHATQLVHDYSPETGEPTYAEGVYVELVLPAQAAEIRAKGKLSFSSASEFNEWLCADPLAR